MAVRWSGMRRRSAGGAALAASGEQFVITSGEHRAVVTEVGSSLRSYEVGGQHLVAGFDEPEVAPAGAGQILAPWPNRIDSGRYSFAQRTYQVPLDEPERGNAIHGLTRWLLWECTERATDHVTLACRLMPQPGYPWPLELVSQWSISEKGLRVTHHATNLGDESCPFGMGVHPYVQLPSRSVDELALQIPATWRLLTNERSLPVSREPIAETDFDFRSPRLIAGTRFDTAFTRLLPAADGTARTRLTNPTTGHGVEVWQNMAFKWLQIYNGIGPSGGEALALAIEPMTCPANAFNSREDLLVLRPGQEWTGSWGIRPYA